MRDERLLSRASQAAAAWAFVYALYRLYYAAGGTVGILGTPASYSQWQLINAIAGFALLIAAVLPMVLLGAWRRRAPAILLALCWVIAVGCIMHALVGILQRILSLTGVLEIDYPFWATIDRRKADLQALFFNEPWFLIEGLLWAAIAWGGSLHASPRRRWWIGSAAIAIVVLTTFALLSAFGVVGRAILF